MRINLEQREVWPLPLAKVISRPLECPAHRSMSVGLGALAIGQFNNVTYDGGFGPCGISSNLWGN